MADTFSLWDEMKAYARAYAVADRPIPVDADCELWLEGILAKKLPQQNDMRREAREFYARELCAMIRDFRGVREDVAAS